MARPAPAAAAPDVEAWSGKDRGDENFPVGSWLIRKELRDHVHAYYAFARNADDISDSSTLSSEQKIERLNAMEEVLMGARAEGSPSAVKLRDSLARSGVDEIHAREILVAFRQDALKNRYANWGELMHYCRYSAAPVGRYVLDLHGEDRATWDPSDALCASLQVLNHMQDCAKDLRDLDRCYIPQDWLTEAGLSTDDVARPETVPALRTVFDRMLDATDELNRVAADLPRRVKARRLRVETAIICGLARRLTAHLRGGDPLATRVKLTKADFLAATLAGLRFAV
ncbi:MAG TPA: squalene synthase HpnC [Acidocella sp.]|uniref:squalene synthase HpnC n=1 Tax=Acidocella sp. TaxID=50710 RepID=UPI002CD63025|nr:squalene synthase HpnC [Acidocella sp.]HVE21298.1 squalene synthase HpnC [Acidocella sp.]